MAEALWAGIDLGRSAVKVVARQGQQKAGLMFPSAVVRAKQVVFDQLRAKAADDTVELGTETYWTGDTALMQNWTAEATGREDDWVAKPAHDVLIRSAMDRLARAGMKVDGPAFVTIGVPSRVFRERRDLVRVVHANTVAVLGKQAEVFVQPQPFGVIANYTLDEEGFNAPGKAMDRDSYVVVEVGQFTTDFAAVVKGQPVIDATASTDGLELVVNHIRSRLRDRDIEIGNLDMQTLMVERNLRIRGQSVDLGPFIEEGIHDVLMPKIMEAFRATFPPVLLQTADKVLVAGGGAPIVIEGLHRFKQAEHAEMLSEPRMAVADGFARLSALMANSSPAATVTKSKSKAIATES